MYKICDKASNLKAYKPADSFYKINLSANESFYSIEKKSIEKIAKEITDIKFNRYPEVLPLELIRVFSKFNNIDSNLVTAGNGSDELINVILETFLKKGQTVVIVNPDFSMYMFYAKLLELDVKVFEKNDNLKIDFKKLKEFILKNNAAAVIFSNPCNPTSLCECKEDLIAFIKGISCLAIIDEAYMEFSDQSLLGYINDFDNLIILKTLSKAMSLAAVRLGFAICNRTLTDILRSAKSPYNVNTVSAKIGGIVLENHNYIKSCVKGLIESKNFLMQQIKLFDKVMAEEFILYDSQTNFIYIETKAANKIDEYLKSKDIVVRCFENGLRITGGTIDENNALIKALKEAK